MVKVINIEYTASEGAMQDITDMFEDDLVGVTYYLAGPVTLDVTGVSSRLQASIYVWGDDGGEIDATPSDLQFIRRSFEGIAGVCILAADIREESE